MDEFILKILIDTNIYEKFASRSLLCIRKYGLMIQILASARKIIINLHKKNPVCIPYTHHMPQPTRCRFDYRNNI